MEINQAIVMLIYEHFLTSRALEEEEFERIINFSHSVVKNFNKGLLAGE